MDSVKMIVARFLVLCLMLLMLLPQAVQAEEGLGFEAFAHTPILHEGRLKPLDSFARIHLQQIYGQDSLPQQTAPQWLAEMLFMPDKAGERKIFHVSAPPVIAMLELPEREDGLYSYDELALPMDNKKEALNALSMKERSKLTANENALWLLYENLSNFAEISRAFSLLLPLDFKLSESMQKQFQLPEDTQKLSYLAVRSQRGKLAEALKKIVRRKGEDPTKYSEEEQEVALFSFALTALEMTGTANQLLRVLPVSWNEAGEWVSPWQVVQAGQGSPQAAELLKQWEALALAYRAKDGAVWNELSQTLQQKTLEVGGASPFLMELEVLYNRTALVPKLVLLYGLAFLLALWLWFREGVAQGRVPSIARGMMSVAVFFHVLLIVTRIVLLNRPPVSTLYESVLFVALIAAAYGLWLSYRKGQRPEGLLIGALLGGGLLAASGAYAGRGDSMGMLIAVLNTNFWLATHVVCITIGYGCSLIAGTLAHLSLARKSGMANIEKWLPFTAAVALLFTAIGTILGGIWADQSWGRFWGWDPKENGALLIVLWLIWVLHGRVTGTLRGAGFAAALACTNIIVAISWFGVNLLNTGLHSYGFTDAAAYGLVLFCVAEISIIVALYGLSRKLNAP